MIGFQHPLGWGGLNVKGHLIIMTKLCNGTEPASKFNPFNLCGSITDDPVTSKARYSGDHEVNENHGFSSKIIGVLGSFSIRKF